MYSYDCVNVLARPSSARVTPDDRQALLDALNQVSVTGANGDQRGFNENSHEGVVDDDVYFALRRDDLCARERRPTIIDARPDRPAALRPRIRKRTE